MSHARIGLSTEIHRYAPASGGSVFPRYSALVAKETVAVVTLVLIVAALVMLATLLPADLFGATPSPAGCSRLDRWSLLSPWCSAVI